MLKTVKDFDIKGKRILVRCDFNVPIDNQGNILDDFRLKKSLPTIEYLVNNKAKIILMSHLGEPGGKVVPMLTLDKVKNRLEKLLRMPIMKSADCIGREVEKDILDLKSGQVLLLENLRFHEEEEDNDIEFSKKLAALGEAYINDAFSACHRSHASIVGIPKYLPHGAGLLLQEEVDNLNGVLKNPKRPMVVIIGGLKVKTKEKFIDEFLEIADWVILGGLVKKEIIQENIELKHQEKMIAPVDNLEAPDISDETIDLFCQKILLARTIIWNGPLGRIEEEKYKKGTLAIANAIIESEAFSVVGGGETIEFLNKEGVISKFSHVSTGGGAMIAYLSGDILPGLKALE